MTTNLPPNTWADALEYEREVLAALSRRQGGKNPTNLESEHRYAFGHIGKIAFRNALVETGVKYDWVQDSTGFSRSEDFGVWSRTGFFKSLIVRTASKPHHQALMVPAAKGKRGNHYLPRRSNWIVSVRIGTAEPWDGKLIPVTIEGWIETDRLAERPVTPPGDLLPIASVRLPFVQLRPISELLGRLFLHADGDPADARQKARSHSRLTL